MRGVSTQGPLTLRLLHLRCLGAYFRSPLKYNLGTDIVLSVIDLLTKFKFIISLKLCGNEFLRFIVDGKMTFGKDQVYKKRHNEIHLIS